MTENLLASRETITTVRTPDRPRTRDDLVNSEALCQLSYRSRIPPYEHPDLAGLVASSLDGSC
jgi:hypothetical protein